MKIEILEPFGYCAGVDRAISMAYKCKKRKPKQEGCCPWNACT